MIENVIFGQLLNNEQYGRAVIPYIKPDYFANKLDKNLFVLIQRYLDQFNAFPNKQTLAIEAQRDLAVPLSDDEFTELLTKIDNIEFDATTKMEWAVQETERFCKDRALYNAMRESIQIMEDKEGKKTPLMIPELLTEALSISFDADLGHDYLDDWEARFDYYHKKHRHLPFHLEMLNKITKGGLIPKTLNVLIAGVNVGKTLIMCDCAANNLLIGKNVLYITLEMSEEEISKRIDANLLNVPLDELELLPKDLYEKRVARVREKTLGKLIVHEYPTSSAGAANFRHLIRELRLKKKFVPDVIYVDYINICCSSRIRMSSNVTSYTYVKAIAEELRGLAGEFGIPLVTATQLNRTGFTSSDPDMDDTAESFGLPATADLMLAITTNDELQGLGQLAWKQLKNRYSNKAKFRRFITGVDYERMRLYDVEASAQQLVDSGGGSVKKKGPTEKKGFEDWQ